jgi:hypothetical protein
MGPPSYMRSVVERNFVIRRMSLHDHSIANNDISIQFLYFTSRNTQYCKNTQQSKGTTKSINLQHTAKHDAIYNTFNTQSGSVHLSCPPEYGRLSMLLTVEQSVRTSKGVSCVICYTWAAAGSCEMIFTNGHL